MSGTVISLNERQQEAVEHGEGPALIIAGAGSGKTRVITARVVRLITSGVAPWSILCVTFTNKAAKEMRDRISGMLGINTAGLWISTFHASCLRIIKEDFRHLGYSAMPAVFDASDQKSLVKSIIKGMGKTDAELPASRVLSMISRFKNEMKGPDQMAEELLGPDSLSIAEAYRQYSNELKRNNAVDFDDLLWHVIKLFQSQPEVLAKYRALFQYIMVDEFQDTNLVQYKIIKLLGGEHRNVFVVGDDDQSIYRWRGARIGNLLGFEKDFPGCIVVKLEENYRSSGNILKAGGELVKGIEGRKEKSLFTSKDKGEKIALYSASSEVDEANYIAGEIAGMVRRGEAVYGDFAVFYRTNAQSRVIEECFSRQYVPYRIYGGQKFYNRKEIKDILAYFRVAVNEMEEVSFLRAVAMPTRGIGPATLEKLKSYANEKGIPLTAASTAPDNGISGAAKTKLADFGALILEIRKRAASDPAADVIEMALDRSGIITALLAKRTAQDNARVENLKELAGAPHKEETLVDFLERISLLAEADNVEESADYTSLMTLHVSKGLEFPYVFIAGMEENLLPHFNSTESMEELDEERRLCYVGITRAMKKLYLTHATVRRIYGQLSTNRPSPFLDDIPADIIDSQVAAYTTSIPIREKPARGYSSASSEPSYVNVTDNIFGVGKQVVHNIFGKGIVKKCEGAGDEMKLTIIFREAGVKKLKSRFVKPAA
ncbi:MAG: UvrD-helicase domain-containing protein [Nitrospinota bacterium]|nr:UvrD-helicase domain-containing protein [Nitrospinota bacterium]